jgi:hypothetical protein
MFILILISTVTYAQTVTKTLEFDDVDTLTNLATYTYSYTIDSGSPTQFTPTCATDPNTAGNNLCTTPISLASGSHTIVVTLTDASGSSSATLNYVPVGLPTAPSGVKIVIKITVP